MIPTIDIQVHEHILRAFYFPKLYGPKEKLDSDIQDIQKLAEEYGDRILNLIERFSGYFWSLPKIPIFLLPDNPMVKYSYSRFDLEQGLPGVVLKIGRGIRDKHILIHELVHINQKHSKDFWSVYGGDPRDRDEDLIELCADIVTLYILRELFGKDSDYEKDFLDFLENTNDKNRRKSELLKQHIPRWDLSKNPLSHYLPSYAEK